MRLKGPRTLATVPMLNSAIKTMLSMAAARGILSVWPVIVSCAYSHDAPNRSMLNA